MNRRKLAEQLEEDERDRRRAELLARVEGSPREWTLKEGPRGSNLRSTWTTDADVIWAVWTEPGYMIVFARGLQVSSHGPVYDWQAAETFIASAVRRIRARPKRRPPNKSRRTGSLVCRLAP